jgi:hypothetical protein
MNTQRAHLISPRNILLIGALLVIVGSFLPWEIEGDFLSNWRYGIQLFPVFADNGGIIVLLLGILVFGLIFRLGDYVNRPPKWILICAIALNIISAYHIIDWLVRRSLSNGIIGAPTIRIGLILVVIGSLLTLAAALFGNSKESRKVHDGESSKAFSHNPK